MMNITTDMMCKSQEATALCNVLECVKCKCEMTYDELLSKYGPEGLYEIAEKMKQVADEDVRVAIGDAYVY